MAEQLASLNDRDAGVVDEIVGYVTSAPPRSFFLFAGAGSGKTRTLVAALRKLTGIGSKDELPRSMQTEPDLRFAREMRAKSQTIRVITYTKNAALVITGRLGLNDLTQVATIHSFCWDLINGFDADIREALLALNADAQSKARDEADGRRNGWTEKDKETVAALEAKAVAIAATDSFTYSPDQNKHGDGALNHAQVLSVATWLLRHRPTLRRILSDQHPVILIDESQDTMKGVLDALLEVVAEDPACLMLGLLGDHRQRIYLDGHADLPSLVPPDWATPKLEMNHRSQRRIVDLINAIWETELEGRTQPTKAVRQQPREEKSAGLVRVFIGDTKLPSAEKVRREALCAAAMAAATHNADWGAAKKRFTVLALEHSLVARRGDFSEAFEAMSLIDPESVKPDPNGHRTGPAVVQVLLREMMELAACVDAGKVSSEFEATEVLHRYGRLQDLPADEAARGVQLNAFSQAVHGFAGACANPEATVRDVLAPVIQGGLFEMSARLVAAYNETREPPEPPKGRQKEPTESRIARGWHALFNAPWKQLRAFQEYLAGNAKLATHQVVKGSEFDHVMVVMDDQDAEGNLFAYDRLFGGPLGDSDIKNMGAKRETSIDRTVRLLYVTCSRAKESLALVLWARDAAQALTYAQGSEWFSAGEVHPMPE